MGILVTGCAGFIGWKVSELLFSEGKTVVGLDNMNDAYDVRLKEWRLSQISDNPNFAFHRVDITDWDALSKIVDDGSIAAVINLGLPGLTCAKAWRCLTFTTRSMYRGSSIFWSSVKITASANLFKHRSSVHGEGVRPFEKSQNTDHFLSPYAASKKAAESLCYAYHHLYGLDVTVLRYFTVYGPAEQPDMSVFRSVKWITEGDPIQLYGDGSQERDFTYVDDIAAGTIATLKPMGFEIINLGSDRPVTINFVIASLERLLGEQAAIERKPRHPADVSATWAEISKAKGLLGWSPTTDLEMGFEQAVAWCTQNYNWVKDISVG